MVPRSILALRLYVFLGAFLLFVLEPMSARLLLPHFGGAFHVWTTALMFFQAALVLGYLYAHALAPRLGRWHLAVLLLPLATLPPALHGPVPTPSVSLLLLVLARGFALSAVLLSTTGVTAQARLAGAQTSRDPYGLYALSNVGSLAGLLLDALVFAPRVGVRALTLAWSVGYGAFVLAAFVGLWGLAPSAVSNAPETQAIQPGRALFWFALPATVSMMLSGVTNQIALDVGHLPLVWALPLAAYLVSFIVAFDPRDLTPTWVRRLTPHIAAVGLYLCLGGSLGNPFLQGLAHLTVFSVLSLAAHDALYRARPTAAGLTTFYLALALGGSVGGAFVALAAPRLFTSLAEHPLSIVLLLVTLALHERRAVAQWVKTAERPALALTAALPLVIVFRLVAARAEVANGPREIEVRRSEYGLYHVFDRATDAGVIRELVSGTTRHGRQILGSPAPLSYYHRQGPLGEALAPLLASSSPRTLGVVGLGVGATAAYLRPGDRATFYEIDPVVIELARRHFRYLRDARGALTMRTGDARTELTRTSERYDVLIIDAFAGDAIPTHLLTREAVAVYLAHLTPDGLLLFHVSNRFFDLRPVLRDAAEHLGVQRRWTRRLHALAPGQDPSAWVALSASSARLDALPPTWRSLDDTALPPITPWTDDRSDALGLLLRTLSE